ncbi:MAG: cupin domain-containing protein [Acidobacteriota bacterium]
MSITAHYTSWSSIPPEELNPLLTRQFVHGTQAMLSRIELKKGCLVPRHAHPNEQIAFLVSGSMRFLLEEDGATQEYILSAGDVLVIPGNVPHSAEALEHTINFDLFAPPRHDWINREDSYLR